MSALINDGGPAFPIPPVGTGDPRDGMSCGCAGMSLRAYLAGQAIAGLALQTSNDNATADWAVNLADAIIARLEKP